MPGRRNQREFGQPLRDPNYNRKNLPAVIPNHDEQMPDLLPQSSWSEILEAYINISGILNANGIQMSTREKFEFFRHGNLIDYERYSSLDLSKPNAILTTITGIENCFTTMKRDPQTSLKLKKFVQNMDFQQSVDSNIRSRLGLIKFSSPSGFQFIIQNNGPGAELQTMAAWIQDVVPKPIGLDHQSYHANTSKPSHQTSGANSYERGKQKEFSHFLNYLLLLMPRYDSSPKLYKKIGDMSGQFLDTFYNIASTINLNFDYDETSENLNLMQIIRLAENVDLSENHHIKRHRGVKPPTQINKTIFARASRGFSINFPGEKNGRFYDYSYSPSGALDFIDIVEAKLRKKFAQNYEVLRIGVYEVAEYVFQEISKELVKQTKEKLSLEQKIRLKFQIYTIYSTWLLKALTQYNEMVLLPISKLKSWNIK
jgi:hypothetical protein